MKIPLFCEIDYQLINMIDGCPLRNVLNPYWKHGNWHPRTTDNSKTKKDDISDDSMIC